MAQINIGRITSGRIYIGAGADPAWDDEQFATSEQDDEPPTSAQDMSDAVPAPASQAENETLREWREFLARAAATARETGVKAAMTEALLTAPVLLVGADGARLAPGPDSAAGTKGEIVRAAPQKFQSLAEFGVAWAAQADQTLMDMRNTILRIPDIAARKEAAAKYAEVHMTVNMLQTGIYANMTLAPGVTAPPPSPRAPSVAAVPAIPGVLVGAAIIVGIVGIVWIWDKYAYMVECALYMAEYLAYLVAKWGGVAVDAPKPPAPPASATSFGFGVAAFIAVAVGGYLIYENAGKQRRIATA